MLFYFISKSIKYKFIHLNLKIDDFFKNEFIFIKNFRENPLKTE